MVFALDEIVLTKTLEHEKNYTIYASRRYAKRLRQQ
jgi:hypothetical protein